MVHHPDEGKSKRNRAGGIEEELNPQQLSGSPAPARYKPFDGFLEVIPEPDMTAKPRFWYDSNLFSGLQGDDDFQPIPLMTSPNDDYSPPPLNSEPLQLPDYGTRSSQPFGMATMTPIIESVGYASARTQKRSGPFRYNFGDTDDGLQNRKKRRGVRFLNSRRVAFHQCYWNPISCFR